MSVAGESTTNRFESRQRGTNQDWSNQPPSPHSKDTVEEYDEGAAAVNAASEDAIPMEGATKSLTAIPSSTPPKATTTRATTVQIAAPAHHVSSERKDGMPLLCDSPAPYDVLCGRGASVNGHPGNRKFRALCFARKAEFDAGNPTVKRRVAAEIVQSLVSRYQTRFLKRTGTKLAKQQKQHPKNDHAMDSNATDAVKKNSTIDMGPWVILTQEQSILKACQVFRDHRRPDRIHLGENGTAGKRRSRYITTPMDDVEVMEPLPVPLTENPRGVNENDVLCGRGAFVNGHTGNLQLRTMAQERKDRFDKGGYTTKRSLALEIVTLIRNLEPPGRFLKRPDPHKPLVFDEASYVVAPLGEDPGWLEVDEERAIHKTCQVMRDIDRADRKERDERRRRKKKVEKTGDNPGTDPRPLVVVDQEGCSAGTNGTTVNNAATTFTGITEEGINQAVSPPHIAPTPPSPAEIEGSVIPLHHTAVNVSIEL